MGNFYLYIRYHPLSENSINTMKFVTVLIIFLASVNSAISTILENGNVTLILNVTENNGILITLTQRNNTKLTGRIGVGRRVERIPNSPKLFSATVGEAEFAVTDVENGFNIFWRSSNISEIFQDCFDLDQYDWFAGKEGNPTEWPVQNLKINNSAYIVRDVSSIAEAYWLHSKGAFIFVNETTPLFVDQNSLLANNLCLMGKTESPYFDRTAVLLNYTIGANDNAREAHRNAIDNYLGRPTGQPNTKMIKEPIWSTWAKYQDDINDELLLDFAQALHDNEFRGQVQIEDGWEECHGSLTFKKYKFAAINNTIMNINGFALRVTLWVHPFVDADCADVVKFGHDNGYFVKDPDGNDYTTSWWGGNNSYLVDFTNEEAANWFAQRVGLLIEKHVLDGFKFEGGEASWAPSGALFLGDPEREPNEMTTNYNSISNFTDFVHVHSGWRTQWLPVFVSIPEKEPNWSQENGLRSVIINLIQLNLAGYTMVLPGLIGGKSLERPSAELYVRWTQAVTFMPSMQFGYLPWEIIGSSFDVLKIVKKFVDLHFWYSDGITNIMRKSKNMGLPVNGPVWWIDPDNPAAYRINDQYLLGENILIAPVLTEGAVSRDIYLPPGTWMDGNNGSRYDGNTTLKDYAAPIDILPYFTKERE